MNPWRVAAFAIAAISILAAIIIGYRKWWVPYAEERAYRRENYEAINRMAKHVAAERQRQANVKNGRSARMITGTPINRQTGSKGER